MTKNLFSVTIFFVVFRETLEAAIIVSVLLGLVNQIVYGDPGKTSKEPSLASAPAAIQYEESGRQDPASRAKIARRMKIQARSVSVIAVII